MKIFLEILSIIGATLILLPYIVAIIGFGIIGLSDSNVVSSKPKSNKKRK